PGPQPVGAALRPGRAGVIHLADAEAVSAGGVDVQLGRHAGPLHGQVHGDAVVDGADGVVAGVDEEQRGRRGGHADGRRQLVPVLDLEVARVEHDGEVRPAADLVDVVDRVVGPLLEVGGGGPDEVSAGGEADHADAGGV